jgi:ribosomal protein S18 acetylase RimI-like enzyme
MATMLDTPRGPVTIRPTREDDAGRYRALRLKGLLEHPEAFGADHATSAARPIEFWQERMRQGAADDTGVTYVAEANGELLGMTSLVRNDLAKTRHAANIYGVHTHPDWRGCGIGDALLGACIAHARALGLRQLRLGVATTNTRATRLYLRHGFRVYGVEAESLFHGGVYYDELLMNRAM